MPPREKIPANYYYYAEVFYKNGTSRQWRFKDKNARRSAIGTFNRDKNVSRVEKTEGIG